jgi:hypothetical protein
MRSSSYILAAAGLSLILLSTPRANAMTTSSPAGLRAGLEAIDLTEAVHCRRYPHRHRYGHRWGRGCGPRAVIIERDRPGIVVRERERSRYRTGVSTTIRSGTSIRSGSSGTSTAPAASGAAGTSTTTKSSTSGAGTTTKSGTSTTTTTPAGGASTGTSTTIQTAPKQ